MVEAALELAKRWSVPQVLVGTLVLATLTSLPNAFTAVRLGLARRGSALVSETLNSNTINLVGGLIVPALWVGRGSAQGAMPYFIWLIDLTLLAVLAPLARGRLSRMVGAVIIAIYVIFVVLRVLGI